MFGIGPAELIIWSIVCLVVVGLPLGGIVAAVLLVTSTSASSAASGPRPARPRPELWQRMATAARLHFSIAVFILCVLPIATPLPWLILGQAGMPLVKLMTIGILLT